MSIKLMSEVWNMRFEKMSHKNVLLALADSANDEGECYPSNKTIAIKANVSKRSVAYAIKELETKGIIQKEIRLRQDGSRSSNLIKLNLQNSESYTPSEAVAGGGAMVAGGGAMVAGGGAMVAPLLNITTNEPSINRQLSKKEKIQKEKEKTEFSNESLKDKYPNLNLEAFEMWCDYKGKKYTKQGKALVINKLVKFSQETQKEMVERSIMNNWQGIFEPKADEINAKSKKNADLSSCYSSSTDYSDFWDNAVKGKKEE